MRSPLGRHAIGLLAIGTLLVLIGLGLQSVGTSRAQAQMNSYATLTVPVVSVSAGTGVSDGTNATDMAVTVALPGNEVTQVTVPAGTPIGRAVTIHANTIDASSATAWSYDTTPPVTGLQVLGGMLTAIGVVGFVIGAIFGATVLLDVWHTRYARAAA